jgi:hypothetical protein
MRLTLQGCHVLVGLETPARLEALMSSGTVRTAGAGIGTEVSVTIDPGDVHGLPAPSVRLPNAPPGM